MLELKNISKVYKQKGASVNALNNINIKFADTGLVFLLGKSGSGKSSLLNIIGNLDKQTSGEILLDGNNVSKFKGRKLDSYLNSYIGFIFQDYNLIDEYNVYKNIDIALSLQRKKKNKENINKILEIVGLTGLGNRKTNELSGGQKQRVAIARALSKDSKIILADEPTGNLDTETSHQIMSLLKQISKEKLVIVVTHDIDLARNFADRIIQIQDGVIYNDTAPCITDIPTKELKLKKNRLSFFKSLQLSLRNLKNKKFRMAITILLTTVSITMLGFSYMLTNFNIPYTHAKALIDNNETKVEMYKAINGKVYTPDSMIGNYTNKDLETLSEKLSKYDIKFAKQSNIIENDELLKINLNYDKKFEKNYVSYAYYSVYTSSSKFVELTGNEAFKVLGRLPEQANEILIHKIYADYIIELGLVNYDYDKDNELVPVYLNFNSYDEILNNDYEIDFGTNHLKVVGIIDEDLSKYESLKKIKLDQALAEKNKLYQELNGKYKDKMPIYVNKDFFNLEFQENKKLDYSLYSYNLLEETNKTYMSGVTFIKLDKEKEIYDGVSTKRISNLNDNEIIINEVFLNYLDPNVSDELSNYINKQEKEYEKKLKEREDKIRQQEEALLENPELVFEEIPEVSAIDYYKLNVQYLKDYIINSNLIGKEITIQINDLHNRLGEEDIATYKVKIVGFALPSRTDDSYIQCNLSNNIIDKYIRENNNVAYTYFYEDDTKILEKLFTEFDNKNYKIETVYSDSMTSLNKVVKKVSKVCRYLSIIFFVFSIILLMNFVISSINKNKRTIGILRALGTSKKDVYKIFILESLIIGLVSSFLAVILVLSLKNYCNTLISKDLFFTASVLIFKVEIIYVILLTVLMTVLIATLLPLYKFSTLKPIDAIYDRK